MTTPNPIPPQVIEKWRAEFEQRRFIPSYIFWNGKEYSHKMGELTNVAITLNEKFAIWLEARSSVEIPLPDVKDYASTMCSLKEILAFNLGKNMTAAKIKSQGYRVKE